MSRYDKIPIANKSIDRLSGNGGPGKGSTAGKKTGNTGRKHNKLYWDKTGDPRYPDKVVIDTAGYTKNKGKGMYDYEWSRTRGGVFNRSTSYEKGKTDGKMVEGVLKNKYKK